jgi:Fic family protein
MFDRTAPYNRLPLLPPQVDFNDVALLKLVNKANNSLFELKGAANVLPNKSILISPLSIREAVASSGIEGINTTVSEALKAEVIYEEEERAGAEKEILRYRDALMTGYAFLAKHGFLHTNSFILIQSILEPNKQGVRRISGTAIRNNLSKEVVYTPPEGYDVVMDKLKNFEQYFNDRQGFDDVDPLIRMAVMHYQFEAIHPFLDGNGRTGRILMILYLVMTERLDLPILFLSKHILENRDEYYRRLRGVTEQNEWKEFVFYILEGVDRQARGTTENILKIKGLIEEYKAGTHQNGAAMSPQMMDYLFSNPFYSQKRLSEALGVHRNTAAKYFQDLEKAGIVSRFKYKQGYVYCNKKLLDILSY